MLLISFWGQERSTCSQDPVKKKVRVRKIQRYDLSFQRMMKITENRGSKSHFPRIYENVRVFEKVTRVSKHTAESNVM